MANVFYTATRKLILDADLDLLVDTIKVVLIDSADYTVSAAHDFLNDVAAVTGDVSEAILVYKDTGVEATSPLIAYIDTVSSGLPVTPNGGDITIAWHATDGVFR